MIGEKRILGELTMSFRQDHPVYCYIRKKIESLGYLPGTPLRIESIADECRSSPIPVRESLVRLAAEDLVDLSPGRGFQVREVSLIEYERHYRMIYLLFEAAYEAASSRVQISRPSAAAKSLRSANSVEHASNSDWPSRYESQILTIGRAVMDPTGFEVYSRLVLVTRSLRWANYIRSAKATPICPTLEYLAELAHEGDIEAGRDLTLNCIKTGIDTLPDWYAHFVNLRDQLIACEADWIDSSAEIEPPFGDFRY
ncbi:MAG: GntR family transcriptional regulator [Alphaproteobacteria bacterium GM202ARS2]|nr:GntR family transcriptional regulator [Alphaproteobacteria bacterium GM202ARS2]